MKNKITYAVVCVLFIVSLMFAEYRFIMENICPYVDNNGTVYLEIFGQVDEYDVN